MLKTVAGKVFKFLYVQNDVSSKEFASKLDEITTIGLGLPCCFSVVPSALSAVECCEYTDYSAIFVSITLKKFGAENVLNVLRVGECQTPIILVNTVDEFMSDEKLISLGFAACITYPYTRKTLCDVLRKVIENSTFVEENVRNVGGHILHKPKPIKANSVFDGRKRKFKQFSSQWDPQDEIDLLVSQHIKQSLPIPMTTTVTTVHQDSDDSARYNSFTEPMARNTENHLSIQSMPMTSIQQRIVNALEKDSTTIAIPKESAAIPFSCSSFQSASPRTANTRNNSEADSNQANDMETQLQDGRIGETHFHSTSFWDNGRVFTGTRYS